MKMKNNLLFLKFSALNFLNAINIQNAGKTTSMRGARKIYTINDSFEANSPATTKNKILRIAKIAVKILRVLRFFTR